MGASRKAAVISMPLYRKKQFRLLPYLLLVPSMTVMVIFIFYPFVNRLRLSFYATDSMGHAGTFVGLRMWKKVLTSSEFLNSLLITLKYCGSIGVGTFALALILSYISVRMVRGSRIYQTMFALPMALATAPMASIFAYIFSKYGIMNALLGTNNIWLSGKTLFPVVVFIVIWANCGPSFIYLLVGFRNVPNELIECAELDGVRPLRKFFSIYLPIASPQVFFVIFLNIITAFKSFTMIKILVGTDESPLATLLVKLYKYAFERERYETGCIYSLILCLLVFLVSRIQFYFEKKAVFYQ